MATVTQYGDISPRTAAYAVAELLKRGMPYLVLEKFGQSYPIPNNSSKVAKFRRYFLTGSTGAAGSGSASAAWGVPVSIAPLAEGVTPAGRSIANQDYTVTLAQYGDYATITSKTASGFTIQFRNSAGTGVERTIDWIAKGYGYQN